MHERVHARKENETIMYVCIYIYMRLAMKYSAYKYARQAKVYARVFHLCKSNTMYSCEYVAGWQIIRRAHMKIKYFVDSLK